MDFNDLIKEVLCCTEEQQKTIISRIKANAPELSPLSEVILEWEVIVEAGNEK